ncbi:MAG: DUF3616 domain-containing protein [Cyanobacteria bacterium J06634_6]
MSNSFLLSRALLQFDSDLDDLIGEISAIAFTPDGSLWLGSDELLTIERLSPISPGIYGQHKQFQLKDFIELFDNKSEIDIEGMAYADGYLWFVGSHSTKRNKPKGNEYNKDIDALSEIETELNRYLLARVPVVNGQLVKSYKRSDCNQETLTAAALRKTSQHNQLIEALLEDRHLGPIIKARIPSKDNGLDIEGLAVCGKRIFLGLRGPVLRGRAVILEIEVEDEEPGILGLKAIGDNNERYRKHFVNLNGLGVRELCLREGHLLILAGPTMDLTGAMQVFQLKNLLDHSNNTIWEQSSGDLSVLFDLPFVPGADKAEGIALIPCLGYDTALMVAHDSPSDNRRPSKKSILADIFRLPD